MTRRTIWMPVDGDYLVSGQAEYQTPIRGLALTAEVATGANGYDQWLLGVRFYFGGNKSLMDRQRRDDPPSLMPQVLHGLGVYGAEFNRKGSAYLSAHPGSGNLTSGGGAYGLVITTVDTICCSVILHTAGIHTGIEWIIGNMVKLVVGNIFNVDPV